MYYFIDVDGVLNRESDWKKPFVLNPECMCNLKKLIDKDKDPHIILSYPWRQGFTSVAAMNEKTEILVKLFQEYGMKLDGSTPLSNKSRQEEIEYYIKRKKVKDYIVLNDNERMFPRKNEINLYLTDSGQGLTEADVKSILKMKKRK